MFNNRFLMVLGVLSLLLVAMAISFPVSNTPTSAEHGRAAYAARWTAMGEYYHNRAEAENLTRSRTADTARWTAMAEYYQKLAKAEAQNLARARAADAARWTAMAEYYAQFGATTPCSIAELKAYAG